MRVSEKLQRAFGKEFEERLARFAVERGFLEDPALLSSKRFLARSVVPHVMKLSKFFNRLDVPAYGEAGAAAGFDENYWKRSANSKNLRLAYFLHFMPANLFRAASVFSELGRLGWRWPGGAEGGRLEAVELGAGPASGACGVAAAAALDPDAGGRCGWSERGVNWTLVEKDRAMVELGQAWAEEFFDWAGLGAWTARGRLHAVNWKSPDAFVGAGQGVERSRGGDRAGYDLCLASFFLNESTESPAVLARGLAEVARKQLNDEGLLILIEPALKAESRRLLAVRAALIQELIGGNAEAAPRPARGARGGSAGAPFRVLLPCLGEQPCGALAAPEDWCHEEATWWRPPYAREIDRLAGLDRKTLPFSYLVIARSGRGLEELLPGLRSSGGADARYRLVSPSRAISRDREFYLCGQAGKCRARLRVSGKSDPLADLERGDVLLDTVMDAPIEGSPFHMVKRGRKCD